MSNDACVACVACGQPDGAHLSDCELRRARPPRDELLERADELAGWAKSDEDIALMVRATLRAFELAGLGQLAVSFPDVLDELYGVASDLRQQAPAPDEPGFLR